MIKIIQKIVLIQKYIYVYIYIYVCILKIYGFFIVSFNRKSY